MSCEALEMFKTGNETFSWSSSRTTDDYSGWEPVFEIRASQGADNPALLRLTTAPTPNGSYTEALPVGFRVIIMRDDAESLPDADPISDPWVGVFQLNATDLNGYEHVIQVGTFVAKKGVIA